MTPAQLKAKMPSGVQAREVESAVGGSRTIVELQCGTCAGDVALENPSQTQTLVTATEAKLSWTTALYGESAAYSLANDRIIALADGRYRCYVTLNGSAANVGVFDAFLMEMAYRVNSMTGGKSKTVNRQLNAGSNWGLSSGPIILDLAANDYIENLLQQHL